MIKTIVVMYVAHIVRIIKNFVAAVRAHGCFSFDVLFIIVCASVTVIFIFIFNFFFILFGGVAMTPRKSPFFAAGHRWM